MIFEITMINTQFLILQHYTMLSVFDTVIAQSCTPQLLEYLILQHTKLAYVSSSFEDAVMLFIIAFYYTGYTIKHNVYVVTQINDLIFYPIYWQHYRRGAISEPTKILIAKSRKSISNSYVSSPTTNVFSTPWYLELVHFIFWFFIFMMFFIYMWLTTFQHQIIKNNENNNLIRETRGFSRSQAGDAITGIVPMTWSISMIMHANLHSINFDDNTSNVRLKLTLIAYQWGWSYFFPKDLLTMSQQFVIGRDRVMELENPKYDYKNLLLREMRSGHSTNRRPYFVDNLSDLNYTPTDKAINSWNCFNNTVYNNYPKKHKLFNEYVNFSTKTNIVNNYFYDHNPFSMFKNNLELVFGSFNKTFTDYLVWNQLSYYLLREYNLKIDNFVFRIFETMKFFDKNDGLVKIRPKRVDKRERKKVENPERAAKKLAKENKKKKKRRSFTLLNDWTKKAVYKNTFTKKDTFMFDSVNNFKEKLECHYVIKRYLNNVHTLPLKSNPFFNKNCDMPVVLKNMNYIGSSVSANSLLTKDFSKLSFFMLKNKASFIQSTVSFKNFSFFLNNPITSNYLFNKTSNYKASLITNLLINVFFKFYMQGYFVISEALKAVYTPYYVLILNKLIPLISFHLFLLHQRLYMRAFFIFEKNLFMRRRLLYNYLYMNFQIFTNFIVNPSALNLGFNILSFAKIMRTFKSELSAPLLFKLWQPTVVNTVFHNYNNPNPNNMFTLLVVLDSKRKTLNHLKIIPEIQISFMLYLVAYRVGLLIMTNPYLFLLCKNFKHVPFIFTSFTKLFLPMVNIIVPILVMKNRFFAKLLFHKISIIYFNTRILGFVTYSLIRNEILTNLIKRTALSILQYMSLMRNHIFNRSIITYLYFYLNVFNYQLVSYYCTYQTSLTKIITYKSFKNTLNAKGFLNLISTYCFSNNAVFRFINNAYSVMYMQYLAIFFKRQAFFFFFVLDILNAYNLILFVKQSFGGSKQVNFIYSYIKYSSFIKNLFFFHDCKTIVYF